MASLSADSAAANGSRASAGFNALGEVHIPQDVVFWWDVVAIVVDRERLVPGVLAIRQAFAARWDRVAVVAVEFRYAG